MHILSKKRNDLSGERKYMMDEKDFKKAYEAYHDMLYRLAVTMTKNTDTAMDVMQDVMLKLFRHKGSFESDAHLKAWLIRVCINRCRDFLRSPCFLKETGLDPDLSERRRNAAKPGRHRILQRAFYGMQKVQYRASCHHHPFRLPHSSHQRVRRMAEPQDDRFL
jgi:RNA polymerase sigma factor (sigma-70 family)